MIEVRRRGEFAVAVAVCAACTERALIHDGGLDPLLADIRSTCCTPAPAAASHTFGEIKLARRPHNPRRRASRHPAYGLELAAAPPAAGDHIIVLVGWPLAQRLASISRKLVVQPSDNPDHLRFDVVGGRAVIVAHDRHADPTWLVKLAQTLVDYGADVVELRNFDSAQAETLTIRAEGA